MDTVQTTTAFSSDNSATIALVILACFLVIAWWIRKGEDEHSNFED